MAFVSIWGHSGLIAKISPFLKYYLTLTLPRGPFSCKFAQWEDPPTRYAPRINSLDYLPSILWVCLWDVLLKSCQVKITRYYASPQNHVFWKLTNFHPFWGWGRQKSVTLAPGKLFSIREQFWKEKWISIDHFVVCYAKFALFPGAIGGWSWGRGKKHAFWPPASARFGPISPI